jgi:hypothetical protein
MMLTPRVPMAIFDRPASQRRWNASENRGEKIGLSSSLRVQRSTVARTDSRTPRGGNSWTIGKPPGRAAQCSERASCLCGPATREDEKIQRAGNRKTPDLL